jgi:hypothetical protein
MKLAALAIVVSLAAELGVRTATKAFVIARWIRAPLILYTGFWIIGALFMTGAYYANPHDPALTGTEAYGHTRIGELARILQITAGEILVFVLVLRPWSYHRSWLRAFAGLVLLTPWLLLWSVVAMHSGPATHAHTSWLLLLWIALAISGTVSGMGAARARRKPREAAV